jgi:hypothetical protein
MRKITCSLKKTERKIKLKVTTLRAGTLLLSNRRAPFLTAPHSSAKTGTSPTRTLRIGATNCTPLKEKERLARDLTLFFSLKALRVKEKGMERAKANQAKAKA